MIGLSDEKVKESRERYGSNALHEAKRESFYKKLLDNFNDPMIRILCIALFINIIFAILGKVEWYESIGILIAVILATLVSTFSEYKNETAFQKLKEMASKIKCKVYRNNTVSEISIDEIVVNDLVFLQLGDKVPADGLMVKGEINVDQSSLNGESEEITKIKTPENYKKNFKETDFLNPYKVFRGSVVSKGQGIMKVTSVGEQTVYGKIAKELAEDDFRDSPLKVKLSQLAKKISRLGYLAGILIAISYLFKRIFIENSFNIIKITEYLSNLMNPLNDILNSIILGVIIIVMAVPEGLPLMIAIVSSLNMRKMLKDNVLVRKIQGIETAGSLNLLFSDKTGTITKGEPNIILFVDSKNTDYTNFQDLPEHLKKYLTINAILNTSSIIRKENNKIEFVGGNATEKALLEFTKDEVLNIENLNDIRNNIVLEVPFDSKNKYSAVETKNIFKENLTLLKGAPEKILDKCNSYIDEKGSLIKFKSNEDFKNSNEFKLLEEKINTLAKRCIRVLGFSISKTNLTGEKIQNDDFTFIGLAGIRDDIRPESILSIKEVLNAGIHLIMITGDRKDTATAIAKEAGILTKKDDIVLSSDELSKLSDDEIKSLLPNIKVIARALPSDKSRLVNIGKDLNLVIGMTGDGVNDSPALKKADVGFSMGGGTEVAKEASDIVILDDNFASIDKAILYGRTIFNSIRKFIIFQLTINISAVMISFLCPLLNLETPLSITQILWINLVIDTLAAIAFGGEAAKKRYMSEKPKKRDENIINKYMLSSIISNSLFITIVSLIFLKTNLFTNFFRLSLDKKYLMTGYFAFFIFVSVFNAFNARTEKINIFNGISKNKNFISIILLIVSIQIIITEFGGKILRSYGLNLKEWFFVIFLSFLIIPFDILRKYIYFKINNKKTN